MFFNKKEETVFFKEKEFKADEVLKLLEDILTEQRKSKIESVLKQRSLFFTPVMEGLYDRGNISAVMRSAEAFGFFNFHIIETQDKFKESHRVTQGADKWLNIHKWSDSKACIKNLKSEGYKVYTTHLSADAQPFESLDFSKKTALIFGNEKKGVSQEALSHSDGNVILPMAGFTQSFNISVAAALSFQRAFINRPPFLDETEQKLLKALYYLRTADWPIENFIQKLKV